MTTASQAFLSTAAPRSSRATCSGVGPRGVRANLLRVEVMGGDVPLDGRRHLARDRSPALYVLPDRAGRNVRRAVAAQDHVILCGDGTPDVSASTIRQDIKSGRSIAGKVAPAVERYIAAHHLYSE